MSVKIIAKEVLHEMMNDIWDSAVKMVSAKYHLAAGALLFYSPQIWDWVVGKFEKYIFNDWEYLIIFCIVVAFDTIAGAGKAKRSGTYDGKVFIKKVTQKIITYGMFLIISHHSANFFLGGEKFSISINDTHYYPLQNFTYALCIGIYFYEADSAIRNRTGKGLRYWVKKWVKAVRYLFSIKSE